MAARSAAARSPGSRWCWRCGTPAGTSGDVLDELTERAVGFVNVDQPLFSNSIKPAAHATSPVGYVRLHGRNYQDWFRRPPASNRQRYDYLYTADELRPWVERIREMAARPGLRELYAVTNNHNLGKAPANAGMIMSMLAGEKVRLPASLFCALSERAGAIRHPGGRRSGGAVLAAELL